MYDYNRGYAPDIESSGCMDIFRIPKFSHAFFRSQRPPTEILEGLDSGPMVFIASHWTEASRLTIRVFSNCEEVELYVDGTLVERRTPNADRISTNLPHPPFTFDLRQFGPGTLEAVGYIGGEEAARHTVRTPGPIEDVVLTLDEGGRPFGEAGKDVAFLRAELRDGDGTVVSDAWENVFFGAHGDVRLVGANPFSSDAGVASVLVQTEARQPAGAVYAIGVVRDGEGVRVVSGAVGVGGEAERWEVHVTTDESEPGPDAPVYAGPLAASGRVRAALFVGGKRIVAADTEAPKFRIAGSTAPKQAG